jgi:TRAP-type C4-dicarboxylate transport system permease small subunit
MVVKKDFYDKTVEIFIKIFGILNSVFLTAIFLLVLFIVLLRYTLPKVTVPWPMDFAALMLTYLVFFGTAMLMIRDEHIGMELVYERLPKGAQYILDISKQLITIFTWSVILVCCYRLITGLGLRRQLQSMKMPVVIMFIPTLICSLLYICFSVLKLFRYVMRKGDFNGGNN